MIRRLYAGAASIAAPALKLMLRRRLRRGREMATRLHERWGEDATPRPAGPLLWLHGASVGEAVSILPVLPILAQQAPDLSLLLTTGTVTSAALLGRRLPELGLDRRALHRFVPLDVPAWVARFLDHWRPDAAAFIEQEIWPNMLAACGERGIRVVLLNARLSARSAARWHRLGPFARETFSRFERVLAQSAIDGDRIAALGGRNVSAPGNLKFAASPLPASRADLDYLGRQLAGRPVWLAASTHPGEELFVLAAHETLARSHDRLLTIIVPRHPPRGAEIAGLVSAWPVALRSRAENPPEGTGIWIADTVGELGLFYRLGGIAFIGGSLVAHGGQNPLEATRLGCAVAVGPHTGNFRDAVDTLARAGALEVVADAESLAAWVAAMWADPLRRSQMGDAGISASRAHTDLPRQTAALLLGMLPARHG